MQKTCLNPWCKQSFEITEADLALLDKLSPVIGGKKFPLPPPALCFSCRLQRRMVFYNSRTLYKNTCAKTGKSVISVYSPDKPFTIYATDTWYSDEWDPFVYGQEMDFSRPFFEQFRELMEKVPMPNIAVLSGNQNSEFTNDNYNTKNSYLVFDGERAENCYHGHTYTAVKDCMDFLHLMRCELCYECIHCYDCYNLRFSRYCTNCSDAWFLRDCTACRHCFGCANLRQKQYCIFNEQKSREEYEAFIAAFQSARHSVVKDMQKKCEKFFLSHPVKAMRGEQNENSTGDNLHQCKDAHWCFDCNEHRETRYCTNCLLSARDCMDVHVWGDNMELAYENCAVGAQTRGIIGCYYVTEGVENVFYSVWCSRGSGNLIGCVGLRHRHHCILNKQYTQEEYEELVPRIIEHMKNTGEWGEFFPPSISMFGYNETMAQSFFPLSEQDARGKGFQWSAYHSEPEAKKSVRAEQLPDDGSSVPDDILNWAILCEVSGRPFKVIRKELDFYRTHKLPVPRRHPDQRHAERFLHKNPYRLWSRQCGKCKKPIQTTYPPERPEIVYCEECYLSTVY